MDTTQERKRASLSLAADADALNSAERLLLKYPEVTDDERDSIAAFLKTGDPIDIGLLSSNRAAWANAERFKVEHRHYFAMTRAGWFYIACFVAALILGLVVIKDMGVR
jgi:hypothetical protein